jgi:tetratricopeptide (TPR) repeat protein
MALMRNKYKPLLLGALVVGACAGIAWWIHGTGNTAGQTENSLRAWVQAHPTDAAASERLADLLVKAGHADQAIPFYEAAIKNDPDNASAPCALAALLAAQGRTLEAQRLLDKNLKAHPSDAATNETLADMLVESLGEVAYPKAQPLYETAVKGDPQRISAALALARIYVSQRRLDAAVSVLEKSAQIAPRNPVLQLELATVLARQQKFDAANPHFDSATALDPGNADALCAWGKMLNEAGKPRAAETVLRRALDIKSSAEAHLQLGQSLRDQSQFTAAMREFELSLDSEKSAPVYLEIARTLLADHQERSAEKFLRDAIGLDRHYTQAKIILAQLLTNAGEPAQRNLWEAADWLRQAVEETQGQDISLLAAHAAALARVEIFDRALEEIDKAIAVGQVRGLTPVQNERLLELHQKYYLATISTPEINSDSQSGPGLMAHGSLDEPFVPPRQPPIQLLVDKPLDVTQPSGPGTALDPAIFSAANLAPSAESPIIIPPGNPR